MDESIESKKIELDTVEVEKVSSLQWNDIKWIKIFLSLIAVTVIVFILQELKSIILPLIFAMFLSAVFSPLNQLLLRHKIPKGLVILLMMLILFTLFTGLGFIIYASINSFIVEFPKYQARMIDMINASYGDIQNVILRLEVIYSKIPEWFDSSQILSSGSFSLPRMITGTMGTFVDFLIKLFLTLVFLAFLVADSENLYQRLKKVLKESDNDTTFFVIKDIKEQMNKYFLDKTLISLGTALTSMLFILIFGIDFVIMAGLLIFVLNFIPNIGSIVASFFPIIICLLQYGFGFRVIGIGILMLMTQMTFGNFIEPTYMGKRLKLSPIIILISLIFWGYVWGIIGMIVAVPLTSVINIIIKKVDSKSLISAIISGE